MKLRDIFEHFWRQTVWKTLMQCDSKFFQFGIMVTRYAERLPEALESIKIVTLLLY